MSAEAASRPPIAFSSRAFGLGMAGVLGLGALLAGYAWLNGASTLAAREEKLASQTVLIQYEEAILSGAEPQPEMFGPPKPEIQNIKPEPENPAEQIAAQPEHGEAPVTAPPPKADEPLALARAPLDGLYEDTKDGRLPKIRNEDKLTPFQAYRRPFTAPAGKPVISIAVMGLGISEKATQDVIDRLPPEATLVLDPYSTNPDFWMNEARSDGHEVWLKLPVETDLYPLDDPGPQTLMINGLERQNLNKLNWVLSRGAGYAGIVTGYNAAFTKAPNALRPALNEIYRRGLGFFEGDPQPGETAASMANSVNAPYAHNNVWIDLPSTHEHLAASLRQLEVLAQGQGSSIGIIHATPMSMEMLIDWISGLDAKGFVLAPLSAQADPKK